MKTAIIITDLRKEPVAAALSLRDLFRRDEPSLLVSSEIIRHNDFGQGDSVLARYSKVAVIRARYKAQLVRTADLSPIPNDSDLVGVWSSLYSITNDSMASREKYPGIWRSLMALNMGAMSVLRYIKRHEFERLCIFNGRLASSYVITRYGQSKGLTMLYYEYSRSRSHRRQFTLTSFPTHNFNRWGKELIRFSRQNTIPSPIRFQLEDRLRHEKLSNTFTSSYIHPPRKEYDIVIFLSSSHEYKALDPEVCDLTVRSELEFCQRIIEKYGTDLAYAVRCHPNMVKDPSWQDQVKALATYCARYGIDLYTPDSNVSSYALIRGSTKTIVDLSSIALDAILLGGDVEIIGKSTYKVVHDAVRLQECHNGAGDERMEVVRILSLAPRLYQEPYSVAGHRWIKGNRVLEELRLVRQ